jgi:hypothetical protein
MKAPRLAANEVMFVVAKVAAGTPVQIVIKVQRSTEPTCWGSDAEVERTGQLSEAADSSSDRDGRLHHL